MLEVSLTETVDRNGDAGSTSSSISTHVHKESLASTVSAQRQPDFRLMRLQPQEQSVDIKRDVLRALPEHYGRAGGARRFSRVNRWEGSSRARFGA